MRAVILENGFEMSLAMSMMRNYEITFFYMKLHAILHAILQNCMEVMLK